MYEVNIYNGSTPLCIHYPTTDQEAPHLITATLKEKLSNPDGLTFTIPKMNIGYDRIEGLVTKVQVIDTRDGSVRFTGRALTTNERMTEAGQANKEVVCEGALAYLNDTNTRQWEYKNMTPTQILSDLLGRHNDKVGADRRIFLGNIEFNNPITIYTNYETTLNAIISKIRNALGGDVRVRQNSSGTLILDYLQAQGANNGVEIQLGYNMKSITKELDPTDVISRIIPLGYGEGVNQLKLPSGGIRYIRDVINGNNVNEDNHWVEIAAFTADGTNYAVGKPVIGSVPETVGDPYSYITDGDITSSLYARSSKPGEQWVQIDLGAEYTNIAYIKVWHYYTDGRKYRGNITLVSPNGKNFTAVYNSGSGSEGYIETSNGHNIDIPAGSMNEYLEAADALAKYGVIETVWTNKDIQNLDTLKVAAQTMLDQNKQPRLALETSALDLSVLTGHEAEKFRYGDTLHIINPVFNIDVYARVTEQELPLFEPWNPNLTISTRPITLTDGMVDLKQRSLSLETAPQGSTYIDTYGYAENIDSGHRFQLPVWISPDILNVNRVRLHIDGQPYRAYETGAAGGGGTTATSSSGGSTTVTSSGGGSTTVTSSSGGGTSVTSSSGGGSTQTSATPSSVDNNSFTGPTYTAVSYSLEDHHHDLGVPSHKHTVTVPNHGHSVTIGDHSHNVSVGSHTHDVAIGSHTHTVSVGDHAHNLVYGIHEDTYPADTYVWIDGQQVAGPFGGDQAWSQDIDLTTWIGQPGRTYNLEASSSRNGRVNVWISIQAFIQAK